MNKNHLIGIVLALVFVAIVWKVNSSKPPTSTAISTEAPTPPAGSRLKTGLCYRNEDYGVVYKLGEGLRGSYQANVVKSEKFPTSPEYKVGAVTRISAMEINEGKRYFEVPCP